MSDVKTQDLLSKPALNFSLNLAFVKLTSCFIVVHVYSFQLKVRVSVIGPGWINSMFVGDNFPKLRKQENSGHGLRGKNARLVNFVGKPETFSSRKTATKKNTYQTLPLLRFGFRIGLLEDERFHAF